MIFHTIEKNGNKYRYNLASKGYRTDYGGNRFHDKKRVLFCVEMFPFNNKITHETFAIEFQTDFKVGDIFVGKWKIYKITWEDSINSYLVYCEK